MQSEPVYFEPLLPFYVSLKFLGVIYFLYPFEKPSTP